MMGLFLKKEGIYDTSRLFRSCSGEGQQWGMRLFDHYRERSIPFEEYFDSIGWRSVSPREI